MSIRPTWLILCLLLGFSACAENSVKIGDTPKVIAEDTLHSTDTLELPNADSARLAANAEKAIMDATRTQPSKTDSQQAMTGTFQQLVEGDYLHFELRDAADGKLKSFFLAKELPQQDWMPFYEHPEYKGKKVKITWRKVSRYLEHAGATNVVEEVTSIQQVK